MSTYRRRRVSWFVLCRWGLWLAVIAHVALLIAALFGAQHWTDWVKALGYAILLGILGSKAIRVERRANRKPSINDADSPFDLH